MTFSMIKRSLIFASALGLSPVAANAETNGRGELKWTHFGIRPLAMGNAYVAIADDFNALFYNPAGLARISEWDGELFNPTVEISSSTVEFSSKLSELANGLGADTEAVLDVLEENTGKNHHAAIGLTPHLIFQGFGFGIGAEAPFNMTVHREVSTEIETGVKAIMPFSFAKNVFEGFDVGVSAKFVARGGINHEFSINDLNAFSKNKNTTQEEGAEPQETSSLEDYIEGGYGLGFDVGMLYTPIKAMSPTIGMSITDLGGTPYEKADIGGEALGAPKTRLPSVNTGVSLKPYDENNMYVTTSMDAHAINQPIHFSKKFNLGVEWGYGSIIKVQSGLHQGEFSGGFEFDVFLFSARFVTYAEQLGTIAGQDDSLSDRRYALQIKLFF